MKARYIVFTAAQAVFCAAAPLVFVFTQYAETNDGLIYKLPLGMLLVVAVVIVLAKNTFLRPKLIKLTAEIAQHEGDLKIESDAGRIANLIAELKRERTIEAVLNAVVPILVLAALLIACRALESAVLELSGAIGFTLGSYVVGTVFGILAAREVYAKHGGKDEKRD